MDPNENLRQQRVLAEAILNGAAEDRFNVNDAMMLAEKMLALDAWLLKGGVFPRAWAGPGRRG